MSDNRSQSTSSHFTGQAARILESITDAFFAVDHSWVITYVNQRAEELLEHSRDELRGTNLWEIFPESDSAPFRSKYEQAIEHDETIRFEAYFDPHSRWYRVNAFPYVDGLAVYFSDITERKDIEQDLRENEARAQAILDTTVDAIITIDAYGNIESFNQAAEKIFGYKPDEVIGENVKILMPEPYRSEHDDYLENYRTSGRRKIIGIGREVTGRRKDGSVFPMDLAVSEVEFEERTIFTGIIRDITKQRELEQEILQISEQERRRIGQDLHDGLGQMLSGTRLISRSIARKLAEKGIEEAEQVNEVADLLQEADEYARTLSHGLVPVDVDAGGLAAALRELTNQVVRLFRLECVFEQEGNVQIYDDIAATHLYRIAQEAVNNAAKHGQASHVSVRLVDNDDAITLYVEDDGVGLPDNYEEKGGMGLHIMRYRARIAGGTLEMHSGNGHGTIVACSVPA